MNEKLILAYHEGMNGHFESVKRLEIYNSSLNNNISNMQKKIMQQSTIFNYYNIKFHNMKKKDVMNKFVKQYIAIKKCKITSTYITWTKENDVILQNLMDMNEGKSLKTLAEKFISNILDPMFNIEKIVRHI
jgi:hypothetical protein